MGPELIIRPRGDLIYMRIEDGQVNTSVSPLNPALFSFSFSGSRNRTFPVKHYMTQAVPYPLVTIYNTTSFSPAPVRQERLSIGYKGVTCLCIDSADVTLLS